jgi:hypothetical protein
MMPEWIIWFFYALALAAFGGICITIYEFLMTWAGCL